MRNKNLNTQYNLIEWKLSKEKIKGERKPFTNCRK